MFHLLFDGLIFCCRILACDNLGCLGHYYNLDSSCAGTIYARE